jgi:hypothetical protein
MNDNYTHIVLLLDASGSMENTKTATITGVNSFIESQKRLPENSDRNLSFENDLSDSSVETKCTVTLAMFSSEARPFISFNQIGGSRIRLGHSGPSQLNNGEPAEPYNYVELYKNVDINNTIALTEDNYDTYGGTPLYDAFYKAITDCSAFVNSLSASERPGRIIFVSYTDGAENESKKQTKQSLARLISEKQGLNWQFIYLGANQDAFSESANIGVVAGQSLNYVQSDEGITRSFNSLTSNVLSKRSVPTTAMFSCKISDLDQSTNSFNPVQSLDHTEIDTNSLHTLTQDYLNKLSEEQKQRQDQIIASSTPTL